MHGSLIGERSSRTLRVGLSAASRDASSREASNAAPVRSLLLYCQWGQRKLQTS